jgi:hypothetical protein
VTTGLRPSTQRGGAVAAVRRRGTHRSGHDVLKSATPNPQLISFPLHPLFSSSVLAEAETDAITTAGSSRSSCAAIAAPLLNSSHSKHRRILL